MLSGLAAVAAAGVSGCSNRRDRRPADDADAETVVVANHPLYVDTDTNRAFTAETGIRVEYHEEIADDGDWFDLVRPLLERGQSLGRDIVVVSDWIADRLERNRWVALLPGALAARRVVWGRGMAGVAYDRDAVGRDLTRIAELFDPSLRGQVSLPTDARLALGTALLADRVDPSTITLEALAATAGRLANSVRLGQVLPFDGRSPIEAVRRGDAAAAVVRASDTVGLEQEHPGLRFVVPEEGGLLLTDVALVPLSPPNPSGAARYLDFVDDPQQAASRFRVVPMMWDPGRLDEVLEREAPDVVRDARRNPPADVRARLRTFRSLDDEGESALAAQFDRVVHAAG